MRVPLLILQNVILPSQVIKIQLSNDSLVNLLLGRSHRLADILDAHVVVSLAKELDGEKDQPDCHDYGCLVKVLQIG
jgi:hypothetical protein